MDLFASMIAFTNSKTIEITCDMVGGARVTVPIGINLVGGGSRHSCRGRLFLIGVVHPIPTLNGSMTRLAAYLVWRARIITAAIATTIRKVRVRTTPGIRRTTKTTIPTPAVPLLTTTTSIIGRGSMIQLQFGLMLELTSFKRHQMCKHIIKREGFTLGCHRGDEGVIFRVETG